MLPQSKEELLAHYATREPVSFVQVDGFSHGQIGGPIGIHNDDPDHDDIWWGLTQELMSGFWDVRILIPTHANSADVIRLLEKMMDSIKRGGLLTEKDLTYSSEEVKGSVADQLEFMKSDPEGRAKFQGCTLYHLVSDGGKSE